MLYSSLLIAASAFTGLVRAQAGIVSNGSYSTNGSYTVSPSSVSSFEREQWCLGQQNNCPYICGGLGMATVNSCDSVALSWNCTCEDGQPRNISNYASTLPSYECINWKSQCSEDHDTDSTYVGLDGVGGLCNQVTCGSANATADASESSSSSESSTSTSASGSGTTSPASTTGGATATTTPTSSTSKAAAATAVNMAKSYGTPILAAGMLGVFGLAL